MLQRDLVVFAGVGFDQIHESDSVNGLAVSRIARRLVESKRRSRGAFGIRTTFIGIFGKVLLQAAQDQFKAYAIELRIVTAWFGRSVDFSNLDIGIADSERRDFLEICDDRYSIRSTVLTSQVPISHWHDQIGDPTVADSILDRLVHNAHRIELAGASIRKSKNGKSSPDGGDAK